MLRDAEQLKKLLLLPIIGTIILTKCDPSKLSRATCNKIENVISPRTIRRRFTTKNSSVVRRKVNLDKRKDFALVHKNWCKPEDDEKWRIIFWNDETKLNLFGNDVGEVHFVQKEFHIRFTKKRVQGVLAGNVSARYSLEKTL